jgi:hypothetical protein
LKKPAPWRLILSLALIGGAVVVYTLDYFIFRRPRELFAGVMDNIAFLFIYILVVIVIFEEVLSRREKRTMMKKMNMVIGTFFNDVGMGLLKTFPNFIENSAELAPQLAFVVGWEKKDFLTAREAAQCFKYKIRITPAALRDLREHLCTHRAFLLSLHENPKLLEHDRFTDLLWAVFHLMDELEMREGNLEGLPAADYLHLSGDLQRAYSQIAGEWLFYALHLKESYPFLFSLAARINPFNQNPSPVVM